MSQNFIELLKNEEQHILNGVQENERIGGLGTNRFIVYCNKNASLVLQRSKDVLLKVNRIFQKREPDEQEWSSLLPDYFVYRCRPERLRKQIEREHEFDKKISQYLSPEDNAVWSDIVSWELSSWVYWFKEENRYWYWWDSHLHDENHIFVAVEVHEWPYPSENLAWLFRGCGACSVEPEP